MNHRSGQSHLKQGETEVHFCIFQDCKKILFGSALLKLSYLN